MLNHHQRYLIEEFAEDYLEQQMARRDLLRRAVLITGSIPLAASTLLILGCGSDSKPGVAATVTSAPPATATPPNARGTGPGVAENDPAIVAESVKYPGTAGDVLGYLARPSGNGTFPGVIVIHENRGLVAQTKDVARRFAKEGFAALAVDLVSRSGGSTPDDVQNMGLLARSNPADLVSDLQSSFTYLKGRPFVKPAALGVTGFCFGGNYTWELAMASPELKAATPFYGTVGDFAKLANVKAAVLALYGGNDTRVTGQSAQVEQTLKTAGTPVQIKVYAGANHAFFNDTGASYNVDAATDAWQQVLAWYRKYLTA